jgi:hypothetical protein
VEGKIEDDANFDYLSQDVSNTTRVETYRVDSSREITFCARLLGSQTPNVDYRLHIAIWNTAGSSHCGRREMPLDSNTPDDFRPTIKPLNIAATTNTSACYREQGTCTKSRLRKGSRSVYLHYEADNARMYYNTSTQKRSNNFN